MKEIIQQNPKLISNWIRQLYFYIIIGGSLTVFCYGTFTFARATLIRYVFPKASNSFYQGYSNPKMQCTSGGNQYYQPMSFNKYNMAMDQKVPFQQPIPTEQEVSECKAATEQGVNDEKDSSFQRDAVKGLSVMIITSIVLAGHYLNRNFFLSKD